MLDNEQEQAAPHDNHEVPQPNPEANTPETSTNSQAEAANDALLTPTSDAYASTSDPYGQLETPAIPEEARSQEITGYLPPEEIAAIPPRSTPPPPPPPPPGDEDEDEQDDEEKGMLRMSFMEHLEELRSRLLRAIGGLILCFIVSIVFCKDLWDHHRCTGRYGAQTFGGESTEPGCRSRPWSSST